jgi:hypothetical protein
LTEKTRIGAEPSMNHYKPDGENGEEYFRFDVYDKPYANRRGNFGHDMICRRNA